MSLPSLPVSAVPGPVAVPAQQPPVQPPQLVPQQQLPPPIAPPSAVQENAAQARSLAAWNVLARGRQLVRGGQPQQALPIIRQFISLKPMEPEGYFWQGVALDNINQTNDALTSFRKGIEQVLLAGMDSAELRLNAGNVLFKQGQTADAIVQYKRAVEIDPRLALAQLNLGRALIETGDITGALNCFSRCDDLHFEVAQLPYYRAKALLKAGRRDDARAQVLTALSRLPAGHTVATKIKQEFAELLQNTQ
jgi:tetratricopeptide (TPR) repeat protein